MWKKEKALITVKTYPNLSSAYEELVCVAGIREDGSWIRLYPIPYRHMDDEQQFEKYHWIEVLARKRERSQDERPESYEPRCDTFKIGQFIGTAGNWRERKQHVLQHIHMDLADLIDRAHNNRLSLAAFKPAQFVGFESKLVPEDKRIEHQAKMEKIMGKRKQLELLGDESKQIRLVDQPDYNFYYIIQDCNGKESRMQIEDWEIQALYRNCLPSNDPSREDKERATKKVRQKYWDDHALKKDLHLFLGTTLKHHRKKAPNPFTIIGTFYPKKEAQSDLF